MQRETKNHQRMVLVASVLGVLVAVGPGGGTALAQAQQATPSQPPATSSPKELPLSMRRAMLLALKNNLQIAVQRFNPSIQSTAVDVARAVFDPVASFSMSISDTVTPASSRTLTFGGVTRTEDENVDFQAGLSQKFALGTDVELVASNLRTANTFNLFESDYQAVVELTIRQPLLKNFGPTVNRKDIIIAQKSLAQSEKQLESDVSRIVAEVQRTYWDLVFTIEDLKVKKRSLRLAQDLLERNKIQVEVGTLAPIEIVQAEAAVAEREENVIVAQDALKDAEDKLKKLLNLFEDPEQRDATIIPIDRPPFSPQPVDLEQAIADALANRPEYARAKLEVEKAEINLRAARNKLLPQLDFVGVGGYSANQGNLGNAVDDITDTENRAWSLGVELSVPMGNREAKAEYTKATLELRKARLRLKNLEQAILVQVPDVVRQLDENRTGVREAVRQVETDIKRVQATRAARVLAEKKLDAEEKKLEVGISTNFQVLEFQEDLAEAESDETEAIIDYNKSLINLERAKGTILATNNISLQRPPP
ncbi:TolC family protein [Nitrospinae bacterium AH_259_B05_G02_I21]|nr:TolC family protein [Nitrospinae bacterium AH_259_B05_G02_I21]MDA2932495.1 TolC family protein [Nitrospinae bacterium AH-259-F20]